MPQTLVYAGLASLFLGSMVEAEPQFIDNPDFYLQHDVKKDIKKEVTPLTKPTVSQPFVADPEIYLIDSSAADSYKTELGGFLVDLLKNECGYVQFYLMENQGAKDLILRCYIKNNSQYWPLWGLNLDNVCRASLYEKRYLVDLEDLVIVEAANGDLISSPDLKHEVAQKLIISLNIYAQNNTQRCGDWQRFVEKNHLLGPQVKLKEKD